MSSSYDSFSACVAGAAPIKPVISVALTTSSSPISFVFALLFNFFFFISFSMPARRKTYTERKKNSTRRMTSAE
jgi:hypothetical protein